jgi:hypothetical protein
MKTHEAVYQSTTVLKFWDSVLMVVFRPLAEHHNKAVTCNKKKYSHANETVVLNSPIIFSIFGWEWDTNILLFKRNFTVGFAYAKFGSEVEVTNICFSCALHYLY